MSKAASAVRSTTRPAGRTPPCGVGLLVLVLALAALGTLGSPASRAAAVDPSAVSVAAVHPSAAGAVAAHPATTLSGPPRTLARPARPAPWLRNATGRRTVFVRTIGDGALAVDAVIKKNRFTARRPSAQALERVAQIDATTSLIAVAARSVDASAVEVYRAQYTVPGIALRADAAALRALAARPDVVSITPIVAKKISDPATSRTAPANAASDVYTRALDAWQQTGKTGAGINIAIIDTGFDYTHADFGGAGTVDGYARAKALGADSRAGLYDPAKFKGGRDFAGTDYNGTSNVVPNPDDNPIDGSPNGHGTHVAGTAAGYGTDEVGATFRGEYTTLTAADVRAMRIGPGSAPQAGIYALKVFGDSGGSTDLSGEALDWIGRQLTLGTHIDVVNMSLGSDYSPPDDPDNAKLAALVARGVLPVVAAGNAGDLTDIGGSPGNAAAALTVAAADSGHARLDAVAVTAPSASASAGPYPAQYSLAFATRVALSGSVQVPSGTGVDPTGCTPFARGALAGKIAWLTWHDSVPECPSATRFTNAENAGAIGVLLASDTDQFQVGINGNATIPGAELTRTASAALDSAAHASTLQITLDDSLRASIDNATPSAVDTLAPFSSRGVHGSYQGIVKPDVSAPGVNITSAASASGDGSTRMSGTSMATPHTAGVAALVRQAHPSWTPLEVKAAVMNTANRDLHDATSQRFGPLRQGTGLVDALAAVQDQVTVSSVQNGALLTASFGVLPVGTTVVRQTRTMSVVNHGTSAVTYRAAYSPRVAVPGVTFAVSPSSISVRAGQRVDVTLSMTIPSQAALRRAIDPTQQAEQNGFIRDYVTAATGVVQFTPIGTPSPGAPSLRIAVVAAPQPVATMHGSPITFSRESAISTAISLTGAPLAVGSGPTRYRSLVAPFVFGAASPKLLLKPGSAAQTLRGLDIRAVGAVSTAPTMRRRSEGMLAFGIQMWGASAEPGAAAGAPVVFIDVNGDGLSDYATLPQRYGSGTDLAVAATYSLESGQLVDVEPLDANSSGLDVAINDNAVVVLPVALSQLGFTDSSTRSAITYQVTTESDYADPAGGQDVDDAPPISFDVFAPPLWFTQAAGRPEGAILMSDNGHPITVHRNRMATLQVLLLHLHDATGSQADIAPVRTIRSVRPAVHHRPTVHGRAVVGQRLQAVPGPWTPLRTTFAYSWLRDGRTIGGRHASTYVISRADVGHRLSVLVVGRRVGFNTGVCRSPSTATVIG